MRRTSPGPEPDPEPEPDRAPGDLSPSLSPSGGRGAAPYIPDPAAWLLAAADDRWDAADRWQRHGIVELRAGIVFDALHASPGYADNLLDVLGGAAGPVIADPGRALTTFLLPVGTLEVWRTEGLDDAPGLEVILRGTARGERVPVPAPYRRRGAGCVWRTAAHRPLPRPALMRAAMPLALAYAMAQADAVDTALGRLPARPARGRA